MQIKMKFSNENAICLNSGKKRLALMCLTRVV